MDIRQLYSCLTIEEKKILRALLSEDGYNVNTLTVAQWIEKVKPSRRLFNSLYMYYRDELVADLILEDMRHRRNIGVKAIEEFVRLRGY